MGRWTVHPEKKYGGKNARKARVLKRVAVDKAARNLEGGNCSGKKGPKLHRGSFFFLGK